MWETLVQPLGREDPLEEGMATHSSILAWRTPWTEEPGQLQSIRSQRVRDNWVSMHTHTHTKVSVPTGNRCGKWIRGTHVCCWACFILSCWCEWTATSLFLQPFPMGHSAETTVSTILQGTQRVSREPEHSCPQGCCCSRVFPSPRESPTHYPVRNQTPRSPFPFLWSARSFPPKRTLPLD